MPPAEYEDEQDLPFSVSFVGPRTLRLRLSARAELPPEARSLILEGEPASRDPSWRTRHEDDGSSSYASEFGTLVVNREPVRFEFRDASGALLTRTHHVTDTKAVSNSRPTPLSFVRSASDLHRHMALSLTLAPGEKLFGCGESFTRLDKRGQKLVMWTSDAYSAQTPDVYKPVPFFLSSRGYGVFVHGSAPMTFDLGRDYDGNAVLYSGDDQFDLFFYFGSPGEVLCAHTDLTGRAPVPPLWSFGMWMGRESYESQDEVLEVARKLREQRIPCDMVHVDVGWTEVPHRCDYEFSPTRFPAPRAMISELREQGFRLSLWQLPYLNPKNPLHEVAVENGYAVLTATGEPPADDAVIDLTNPDALRWYQGKLAKLLEMGVGVLVADFGEAASLSGVYASKKSGFPEHNLYPLRYNKAVAEVTERVTGRSNIWARSAWAGSQRYPVHWGGDAENTDSALASSLRGGLSLGLCGFSFWGTFIGEFPQPCPADLYLRWLAFGMLCSHGCCHGAPPKEPWEYGPEFTDRFRRVVEMKYRLMPYVYAQATLCSRRGHPMVRPLFFEFPEDPTSWLIEDQYMFGEQVLVAPLLEDAPERDVYLPPGAWTDYESGRPHTGAAWHRIRAGEVPVVVLVRDGAAIPCLRLAQSTVRMDWREIELRVFGAEIRTAEGTVRLPGSEDPFAVHLERRERGEFALQQDPSEGKVAWKITSVGTAAG